MSFKLNPRMRRVYGLARPDLFTLNLGSGETSLGDVTSDIDPRNKPTVVADATRLPFQDGSFGQVIFADVIEHIEKGTEMRGLSEIYRVLAPGGVLVLSTPNDVPIYTLLDPAHHFSGHRHYTMERIRSMALDTGFDVIEAFTAGGPMACAYNLFAMGTARSKDLAGGILRRMVEREYSGRRDSGYTIFLLSRKPSVTS